MHQNGLGGFKERKKERKKKKRDKPYKRFQSPGQGHAYDLEERKKIAYRRPLKWANRHDMSNKIGLYVATKKTVTAALSQMRSVNLEPWFWVVVFDVRRRATNCSR